MNSQQSLWTVGHSWQQLWYCVIELSWYCDIVLSRYCGIVILCYRFIVILCDIMLLWYCDIASAGGPVGDQYCERCATGKCMLTSFVDIIESSIFNRINDYEYFKFLGWIFSFRIWSFCQKKTIFSCFLNSVITVNIYS